MHTPRLPNSLKLTYGQIVALGGEFYGIPESAISDGATPQECITRFINVFNSLAVTTASVDEATKILQVMQTEIDAVNQALAAGQSASSAYDALGDTLSAKWNRITGGGSVITPFYPLGRYLKLAAVNWDHFGSHAVLAYQAGHTAAIQQALAARTASNPNVALQLAYAMNAFADHFLSDLFSSGHMRAPRKQLYEAVTPAGLGSLLTRYMHDEDCHWGLNVTSASGQDIWHAYGDKRYFDTVDTKNRQLVDKAVQFSVNEVFDAFQNGTVILPSQYSGLMMVAKIVGAPVHPDPDNYQPLFFWDGTKVLRRDDINNLNDTTTTSTWWGWSTLTALKTEYQPNPPAGWMAPPAAAPGVTGWSGNASVPPNWVQGNTVRYAVSVLNGYWESDIGPWSATTTIPANAAYPVLGNIPLGPNETTARKIYRQISNQPPTLVATISDNVTTNFIDNAP